MQGVFRRLGYGGKELPDRAHTARIAHGFVSTSDVFVEQPADLGSLAYDWSLAA